MEIFRALIDQAVNSVIFNEYCDGIHDENCHEFHSKYIESETLGDYEKSIIGDVYNYYLRCVNYIKDNWSKGYYKNVPDINIMQQVDLFLDHFNNGDDSVIIKTITRAHKLHDRILRSTVPAYDFDGCECKGYTPAFTGKCDCGNRRVKLSHKNVNWIDRFSLDSKETVSVPVGY
ncbi:hypothetical protein H012_gp840 [Acanthamoeba polyphaga moumouvirus]|uniref:Uncharacterized protein n=1 Tax=Acanthamoeba polyphaga moumouvirus TaxID=1269028 RepID=L7RFN6_9VIRU|nr:hypothetical protein H012_gp840 [Acanthamoeba polyphaga moumouvirus]AGC01625.1 hypothetical protein Moumou_00079 [Acanthamoeba polyphaga moumouvirus]AQN67956.1 hypothetical protein [Saudi moumouvirus]